MSVSINPGGEIKLLRMPIESDYQNQIKFKNIQAQRTYFQNLQGIYCHEYSYIRKDKIINVNMNYDEISTYNYLYYINTTSSPIRWYYCFITKMEYVNDNCTRLSIETDVYQTWQFDIIYNQVFVEREHVEDDTIGLHTIPEGLETGEYINNGTPVECGKWREGTDIKYVCFACSDYPSDDILEGTLISNVTNLVNGIFSGLYYFVVAITDAKNMISLYDYYGRGDNIQSLFMCDIQVHLSDWWERVLVTNPATSSSFYIYYPIGGLSVYTYEGKSGSINKSSTINGYTPKNNKMLTFPYCYLSVTNNSGAEIDYRYEDFSSSTIIFKQQEVLTPSMSRKIIPQNYKGIENNYNEGIILGKLPVCSWTNDTYINWLTQNGMNMSITERNSTKTMNALGQEGLGGKNFLSGLLDIGKQTAALTNVATNVLSSLSTMYQYDLAPMQASGNVNSGDINYSMKSNGDFTLIPKSIKKEYANIIDKYFSRYGYKVSEIKTPNLDSRRRFNYIKTIGCSFDGNIPQEDMLQIRQMFDNGVTIWHDTASILDYASDNPIV